MLTSTLRNVGGSVMMAIPKALLEDLGLTANTKVALRLDHGALIVAPLSKAKYTLAELLSQCDLGAPVNADVREWQDIRPVGKEII